jgi:hypothetical protein
MYRKLKEACSSKITCPAALFANDGFTGRMSTEIPGQNPLQTNPGETMRRIPEANEE